VVSDDLLIKLNPAAYARLRALMDYYGDTKPESMISRALGLLELLQPYVGADGVLTVVNSNRERNGEDREVDLIFENLKDRFPRAAALA
jgi:hypothetical protein